MVKERYQLLQRRGQSSLVMGVLTAPTTSGVTKGYCTPSAIWNTTHTQKQGAPVIIILFPLGVCSAHVPISRVQFLSGLVKASQILN